MKRSIPLYASLLLPKMIEIQLIIFEIHLIVIDMSHKDLFLCSYVFSSDDDGNPVADIFVGYDASLNLVVLFELTDYDFLNTAGRATPLLTSTRLICFPKG